MVKIFREHFFVSEEFKSLLKFNVTNYALWVTYLKKSSKIFE